MRTGRTLNSTFTIQSAFYAERIVGATRSFKHFEMAPYADDGQKFIIAILLQEFQLDSVDSEVTMKTYSHSESRTFVV